MEYRGVKYQIRARPGNNEWSWTIWLADGVSKSGEVRGPRQRAVIAVQDAIDRWLKRRPSAESETEEDGDETPAARPGFPCVGTGVFTVLAA